MPGPYKAVPFIKNYSWESVIPLPNMISQNPLIVNRFLLKMGLVEKTINKIVKMYCLLQGKVKKYEKRLKYDEIS